MISTILDVLAGIMLVGGGFWCFAAAIGVVRFPSDMARLHAASKPQVLGLLMFLLAVALAARDWRILPFLALAWIMQLVTVPISAHIVARTAHRTANEPFPDLARDDLAEDLRANASSQSGEPHS
jgi:multicomponent Na+:H+ antiporter subunit G